MSASQPSAGSASDKKQRRMGPAPFASFEDLSDELESPEDKQSFVIRLPGIHEDATTPGSYGDIETSEPDSGSSAGVRAVTGISLIGATVTQSQVTTASSQDTTSTLQASSAKLSTLQTPCTPRIDISRASSSSHHEDSRDSTPDNQDAINSKLGAGFREEGALELRSSTEELDFHDPTQPPPKPLSRPPSPLVFICDSTLDRQRKDSNTSEICLLSISGRTSRLSSIGSQGSERSHISTASHLSVMSGQSATSRSTSPHKMLLETSFCGSKPNLAETLQGTSMESKEVNEALEKVFLSRKHDPREAILAEGITITAEKKSSTHHRQGSLPTQRTASVSKKQPPRVAPRGIKSKTSPTTPGKGTESNIPSVITTPPVTESENPQTETKQCTNVTREKLIPGQIIKSECGVEYTYVPLKGPLPPKETKTVTISGRSRSRETPSRANAAQSSARSKNVTTTQPGTKQPQKSNLVKSTADKEPEYIIIKLKPDHCYDDSLKSSKESTAVQKPESLNLASTTSVAGESPSKPINYFPKNLNSDGEALKLSDARSSVSSKSSDRGVSPSFLLKQEFIVQEMTGSPSLSRRNSLFKSKEAITPDCSTPTNSKRKSTLASMVDRERSRSRSKSRERTSAKSSTESIDSKHKQKGSVFSIFKPKKTPTKSKTISDSNNVSSPESILINDGITNVEFKFDSQKKVNKENLLYHEKLLEGDSIRIPLHSPSYYENKTFLSGITDKSTEKTECTPIEKHATPESPVKTLKHNTSTSSENIVFSTKLGSNDEIFSTKLPKEKHAENVLNVKKSSIIEHHENEKSVTANKLDKMNGKVGLNQSSTNSDSKSKKSQNGLKRQGSKCSTTSKTPDDSKNITKTLRRDNKSFDGIKNFSEKTDIASSETAIEKSMTTAATNDLKTSKESFEKSKSLVSDSNMNSVMNEISNRNSMASTANEETSENSGHETELDAINKKKINEFVKEPSTNESVELGDDQERKTLVVQEDSFDDDLPYIPTTLPLERSVAIPIIPIKQRTSVEMKTCPIERPRSTTPINPSTIDDYCSGEIPPVVRTKRAKEKLKISLPREDTIEKIHRLKSPRKAGVNPKSWHEFAEKGLPSHQQGIHQTHQTHTHDGDDEIPPPLPPRSTPKEPTKQWINFEEIPERHKPPKRIQTIPSRGHIEISSSETLTPAAGTSTAAETVVYSYVNPEDCQCECHETAGAKQAPASSQAPQEEAEIPLLQAAEDESLYDDSTKGFQRQTSGR